MINIKMVMVLKISQPRCEIKYSRSAHSQPKCREHPIKIQIYSGTRMSTIPLLNPLPGERSPQENKDIMLRSTPVYSHSLMVLMRQNVHHPNQDKKKNG